MMNHYIIIVLYFVLNPNLIVNWFDILNEEVPKEVKHGSLQNDSWSKGKSYQYYINTTDYEMNEENTLKLTLEMNSLFLFQ